MSAIAQSNGPTERGVSAGSGASSLSPSPAPRRSHSSSGGGSSASYISVVEGAMRTVGIDPESCDPLVVAALIECSRRVATDLLLDAKDLSVHAGKQEIDVRDAKLAVGMYDSMITDTAVLGGERLRSVVARDINSRPLLLGGPSRAGAGGLMAADAAVAAGSLQCSIPKHAVRMVPEINSSLLKRSFSYIPGGEAYELPSQQTAHPGGSDASSGMPGSAAGSIGSMGAAVGGRTHLPPTAPRIQMSLSGAGVAAGSNSMSMTAAKRARVLGVSATQAAHFGDE